MGRVIFLDGLKTRGQTFLAVGRKNKELVEILAHIRMDKSLGSQGSSRKPGRRLLGLCEDFCIFVTHGWGTRKVESSQNSPFVKKGSGNRPGNSVIEKLLEKILSDRIYVHFKRQGLIRKSACFCVGKIMPHIFDWAFEMATIKIVEGRVRNTV